jgi:hypothetical protein
LNCENNLLKFEEKTIVHRLIPSKFPTISLFDWATSEDELHQIALLEGLTNERLQAELGHIHLVEEEDWIAGIGSTPLMAAFTHIGHPSRFSDGSYGVYYAAQSLEAAVEETIFHRELFYQASHEPPCSITMREYRSNLRKPLLDLTGAGYGHLLHPDPHFYEISQIFGKRMREEKHWGLWYPSVRKKGHYCIAAFRPPALSIPVQGSHLSYIWDGIKISEVYQQKLTRRDLSTL